MTSCDAGDRLENRKLEKDKGVERYPRATFTLARLENVTRDDSGGFRARARGTPAWPDRTNWTVVVGAGTVTGEEIRARGNFGLDITTRGIAPPRLLMFKVEREVTVEVTLLARAR